MVAVSFLISVYNGECYIEDCLQSVFNQTFSDYELIVVNDCSTDSTQILIQRYKDKRVKLINNPTNYGLTKSLNIGLKFCQGSYIARLDADDIASPHRIARQFQFMEKNKHVGVLGTNVDIIDTRSKRVNKRLNLHPKCDHHINCIWTSYFDSPLWHSTAFMRKSALCKVKLKYDEDLRTSQDYKLWLDCISKDIKISNLREKLVDYRVSTNSISNNYSEKNIIKVAEFTVEFLKKEFPHCDFLESFPSNWIKVTNNMDKFDPANILNLVDQICLLNKLFLKKYDKDIPNLNFGRSGHLICKFIILLKYTIKFQKVSFVRIFWQVIRVYCCIICDNIMAIDLKRVAYDKST